MFLSVCLKGGKATVEPLPVTDQRSDFSLCPVSEGQPHKHTLTRTHTHTQSDEQGMQLLESLPVRAFCLSPNELQCAMFVYLRACERARDRKTAGGSRASDQRHAEGARTHQSEEQVLTRRHPRLILAALVRRKLVSSVYHLLCVL